MLFSIQFFLKTPSILCSYQLSLEKTPFIYPAPAHPKNPGAIEKRL